MHVRDAAVHVPIGLQVIHKCHYDVIIDIDIVPSIYVHQTFWTAATDAGPHCKDPVTMDRSCTVPHEEQCEIKTERGLL